MLFISNPMMEALTAEIIHTWLEEVKDPEIPVLSLTDLGVITDVLIRADGVLIQMTPTFVGCPALDMMQADIRRVLSDHGISNVDIEVSYHKPWTSDMITARGKAALKSFGLAPPPPRQVFTDLEILERAECPRCDGTNTELKSTFGATLCRAMYYCNDCREAFEQFKPL